MPIDNRDYKDARDERRRSRQGHLELRRTSGKAFEGGRSQADIALSSETGFAETETIAPSAVNAIATVFDDGVISLSGYGAFEDLEVVTIEGGGYPVLITFTDIYSFTATYTDDVSISYRIEVNDPDGNTVIGFTNTVFRLIVDAGETYNASAESPDLFVVADLEEGVLYDIVVQFRRDRDVGGDTIDVDSNFRNLIIHELKR